MKFIDKNKNRFKLFEPFILVVFWVLLFASPIFLDDGEYGIHWESILNTWVRFIPYLILFLVNRFLLLPYLFFKNKRGAYLAAALVLIVTMSWSDYYFQENFILSKDDFAIDRPQHPMPDFMPPDGDRPPMGGPRGELPRHQPPKQFPPFVSFGVIALLVVGFDTGLKLSVKWVQSEQKRMTSDKENVQMQLAFLRNQVSPHFFMNTLNNIHSLIDQDTGEAKETIIRLSKLMRHLLYESEAERISIAKEIEFIHNYVDLMRLRYSDKVRINVQLLTAVPDKKIPPLLFTSFVENAFKHGISYQHKSYIDVSFSFSDDSLYFIVKNSKSDYKSTGEPSGIGITNSRKRMNLLYGDNYTLELSETSDEFTVKLKIPL